MSGPQETPVTDHDGLIEFAHEWLLEQKVATPEGDLVNGLTAICEDLRAAVAAANQRAEQAEKLLAAADEAVTELLTAIALEQPNFEWTAERTADAIDRLTKTVLPLGVDVPDDPRAGALEAAGQALFDTHTLAAWNPHGLAARAAWRALVADQPEGQS